MKLTNSDSILEKLKKTLHKLLNEIISGWTNNLLQVSQRPEELNADSVTDVVSIIQTIITTTSQSGLSGTTTSSNAVLPHKSVTVIL